jgi:large subunit ribosomal protein L32
MPVPYRRVSKTRRNKRRTHQNAPVPTVTICENCGSQIRPHNVCKHCGYYQGKQVKKVNED